MKAIQRSLIAFSRAFARAKPFCVVGHIRPDGDCIGSQIGLTLALLNEGKKVVCWNQDPVPQKIAFLDPKKLVPTAQAGLQFDCVIATDAASLERLGTVVDCINDRKLFINIDHHASNTRYADINWVSAREPSTGELIYRLLKVANWPITARYLGLPVHSGFDRYWFVPISHHPARHLSRRGRTGEPRRESGEDLR